MRNIVELIGIIQGINFDGVINEKEIKGLKQWVDKNRNLAYDKIEVELINIVDKVLEDGIIDKQEKKLLVSSARNILLNSDEVSTKIYELNGIIEGVICDEKINKAEIIHLKKWMDDNGDLIKGYSSSVKIANAIDNILEDEIVTEEEKESLLKLLSDKVQDSQFNSKIDYLCKKVKQRENIGVDLIDVLDSDNSIIQIHKKAEEQLLKALSSYSGFCSNREIIVISLVLIAMLEYDGNYYENVRNTYLQAYERYSEQKVEGLIRSILSRYKHEEDSNSRVRIINVALENSIVPQDFLPGFFEFIFDIYKYNFEYDIPDDLFDEFKFVYEGLKNNLLSEGDDISINVTQKTYKLIAATKKLLTREDGIDAVIRLSILIVKLIDKRYWNKPVNLFNPYLKSGYEVWEKQLAEKAEGLRSRGLSELKSRWEPKFYFENNSVMLVPPVHKVKAQYDYKKIEIVVENDDLELYRNSLCDIREIIGGYQINSPIIKIKNPIGKLKYKLICGEDVIYDSKDKLFRNYIIFDNKCQEISNNTDYEGNVSIIFKFGECNLELASQNEHYCVAFKLIRSGDSLQIGNDVFNFSSFIKPGIFGQLHKNCFIHDIESDLYIPIYKEMNVVVFEADSFISKFEISINDKPYKLSDLSYKNTIRNNISKYVVELDIKEANIYELEIKQIKDGKKNRLFSTRFAYDPKLTYSSEKIDDDCYEVLINSDLLDKKIKNEITVDNYDFDSFMFKYDNHEYSLVIPLEFKFFRVDNSKWCSIAEDLWVDEINYDSKLYLLDTESDELSVYDEDGHLIEDNIAITDKEFYKIVNVGFLNSYKNNKKYEKLVFMSGGRRIAVIYCFNKCVMEANKTEIIISNNEKRISVTPNYRGKNKVFFEVINDAGEIIFKSKFLESGQTDYIDDFDSFREYIIRFHEKTNILQLRKNTLLLEKRMMFYSKDAFIGRRFKISEICYNEPHPGLFLEKTVRLNKCYIQIDKTVGKDIFLGSVFVQSKNEYKYLNKINPVEIELCGEIVEDSIDAYIVNDEYKEGLLLDEYDKTIMNTLESKKAPDIFIYTLDLKRKV